MATRIPSLTSLRAFEAVARHKSFRKAADEICVTHAAISHQIKALEASIGVQLLERTSRSVKLTPAGDQYYPPVREHIQGIVKATRRIQLPEGPDTLLVQSYASFNTMWLQPRLADFLQAHPNIRVRITSTFEDGDYDLHRFDVGVFYGPPFDKRFDYSALFKTDIYPVCAPDIMGETDKTITLDDLRNFPLLSIPSTPSEIDDWDCWLAGAGLSPDIMKRGPIFDNYPLIREAVLKKIGICIARAPFCAADIEKGRLVKPFDIAVPEPSQWYLATLKDKRPDPNVALFTEWLVAEVASDPTMEITRTNDHIP